MHLISRVYYCLYCTLVSTEHREKTEKVSYAKRMAQGYLRSMGMGEWTPKSQQQHEDDAKNKQASPSRAEPVNTVIVASKWKNIDDDDDHDFDF